MNYRTILYVFYVSLLGSSFCLGLPRQSDQNNEQHSLTTHETTTAEPIHTTTKTIFNNSALINATSIITTQRTISADTTTAISHENASTKIIIHQSQPVEVSTEKLHSPSVHTTTAIPIVSSSSTATSPQRQFDILSFMGGSLFTFCLMAIGVVSWKAYKMQIERNYRTI